jgi:protein O-mannosyl-transferase
MTKGESSDLNYIGPISLLALLVFAFYGQSIFFDYFILDDAHHVKQNEDVIFSIKSFFNIWKTSKMPVVYNLWQLISGISGKELPYWFRMANLVFHCFNGALVYKLVLVLYGKIQPLLNEKQFKLFALFISTIFILHPVQVESVVWVSSFRGIISTFFGLVSTHLFLKFLSGRNLVNLVFCYFSFVLALFSKATLVSLPLLFLFISYFIFEFKKIKNYIYIGIPFLLVGGSSFYVFQDSFLTISVEGGEYPYLKLLLFLDVFFFYFKKLIWPFDLNIIYGRSIRHVIADFKEWSYLIYITLFYLGVLSLSAWSFLKKKKSIQLGMMIYFILLLPVSGLISFDYQLISIVADRYLYFPVLGWAFLVASALFQVKSVLKGWFNPLVLLYLIKIGGLTFWQISLWDEPEDLFQKNELSGGANYYSSIALGVLYLEAEEYGKAELIFNKIKRNLGPTEEVNMHLMKVYAERGLYEEAYQLKKEMEHFKLYGVEIAMLYDLALEKNMKTKERHEHYLQLIDRFPKNLVLKEKYYYLKKEYHLNKKLILEELIKLEKEEKLKVILQNQLKKINKNYSGVKE